MLTPDRIRSFTLLGGTGCGKSALAEALLFRAGVLHQADGGTTLDSEPEEQRRQSTVFSKVQSLTWKKHQLHFADTPGGADFVGAAVAPLAALDAAVIVIDATVGVEVSTRQFYEAAVKLKKPVLFFINKLDKEFAEFDAVLSAIRSSLTKHAFPVALPMGQGGSFSGVIDLLSGRAHSYAGGSASEVDVPEGERQRFEAGQNALIEEVAETDEVLFDKLADGAELTKDDILPRLIEVIEAGEIAPVLVGSAYPPQGSTLLLDTLTHLILPSTRLPPPSVERETAAPAPLELDPQRPPMAQVFKIFSDQGVGDMFYLKVVNGTLKSGVDLVNAHSREKERIGHMFRFQGKERIDVPEATIGDVVAVAKLKGSLVGDTLASADDVAALPRIEFPSPVHSVSVQPKTRKDQDKMGLALNKLSVTDPTIQFHMDPEFNETILSGMGEVHLEIAAGRLKERYGIELLIGQPHVPYRETLLKKSKAQGRHKKQTGGHGQFGDCWISVEPLPMGSGFEFVDEIKGGVIPGKFIPSVETGVKEAMKKGSLAGFPVVDVRVTVFDGSFHSVDSSDVAFQMAGSIAFKKCQELSGSTLLEPVMKLKVIVPGDYVGAITNQLSGHRGRILGMDAAGDLQTVTAEVPMAELFDYSTELRSITHGAGSYTMEFSQYEPIPSQLLAGVVEKINERREKAS